MVYAVDAIGETFPDSNGNAFVLVELLVCPIAHCLFGAEGAAVAHSSVGVLGDGGEFDVGVLHNLYFLSSRGCLCSLTVYIIPE